MAIPKITGAQRDFSAGEIDSSLKRNDEHPARKAGVRQMQNWRILNSQGVQNRSGRSALFPLTSAASRTEEVTMSAGNIFKLVFSAGKLQIYNSANSIVQTFTLQGNGTALPWAANNLNAINFGIIGLTITICFGHLMRPQVVSWDGVSTWSIADYTELLIGNQKRTPFYRISPQGITLKPGATTGSGVSVVASSALFTPSWVGARFRFVGRQLLATSYVSSTQILATVEEPLPGSQGLGFATDPRLIFSLGDEVIGSVTGAKGIVAQTTNNSIFVQLLTQSTSIGGTGAGGLPGVVAFTTNDSVVGPGGALTPSIVQTLGPPLPVTVWDDEVMNSFRGFPGSCFVDQFRLGFCDFPSVPGGIGWSAINSQTDLYVGANPSDAMFEIAPDKVRVLYVVPGPESSEFVFCDKRLYYIPINPASPLKPGGVSFQILLGDGAAAVQPRVTQEVILYVGAGGNSVMAVIAPGAYYRPFNTRHVSQFHSHLFNNIVAIATPNADGTFLERYAYVLNANGSLVVGKYTGKMIEADSIVGWGPWSGGGAVNWVSALGADVLFTSSYFGTGICEILDDTQYLDAALPVNNLPAPFVVGGKGPLFYFAGQTVTLMDQTTRVLGTYQIDANGNLIAQNNAGEDFTVASLVAGQPWTSTLEPFVPDANPGTSVHQRMFKRRVSRMAVAVTNSTGFLLARLFSGPVGPNQPALGTIMNQRRVTTYNQDDDPTVAPFLREDVERWRPLGRYFDPRVAVIKDTPGPLLISEFGLEASI